MGAVASFNSRWWEWDVVIVRLQVREVIARAVLSCVCGSWSSPTRPRSSDGMRWRRRVGPPTDPRHGGRASSPAGLRRGDVAAARRRAVQRGVPPGRGRPPGTARSRRPSQRSRTAGGLGTRSPRRRAPSAEEGHQRPAGDGGAVGAGPPVGAVPGRILEGCRLRTGVGQCRRAARAARRGNDPDDQRRSSVVFRSRLPMFLPRPTYVDEPTIRGGPVNQHASSSTSWQGNQH